MLRITAHLVARCPDATWDHQDEQLDDTELAEIYPRHVPTGEAPPDCYHLARRTKYGPEPMVPGYRGQTLDVCRLALETLLQDPPDDRDMTLCVVRVWGQWSDAEVVLTAEEIVS